MLWRTILYSLDWCNLGVVLAMHGDESQARELFRTAVRDAATFEQVLTPLLQLIGPNFVSLHQKDQLEYVLATIHFNWAMLVLLDEFEAYGVQCPGQQHLSRSKGVRAISNVLKQAQTRSESTSILFFDPIPEATANAISTAAASAFKLYDRAELSADAMSEIISIFTLNLQTVSQITCTGIDGAKMVREQSLGRGIHVAHASES
ncbi:uncharacterized protein N7459_009738 [Penicillium hispanicum]|uniref:uncharacterized protein n=1 Tax=Penicillium hispanicum TaxID=1080232 RepID=UPI00254013EB|nr:uncharacterized protein N7459_009738 [Penicillium hispanicum]KAJ5570308.1 hypothetical protein N7459_009738 [Penicillium hispanicum]